jgi:O-antigen/teichoic acid export membrane protein
MLGAEGRGQTALVVIIALLCSQLGIGGLPPAIAHTVAATGAPARDVLRGQLRVWFALSLLPALASAVLAALLLGRTGSLVTAAFLIGLLWTWTFLLAGMLLGEGEVRHANALRLSGTFAYVSGVAALFVVHRTHQAAVVLLVYAAAQFLGLGVGWGRLRPPTGDPALGADRRVLNRFARRSFVSGVSAMDGLGLDHLVVGAVLGQAPLGLYAVAASSTNLPAVVLGGVSSILLPRMAALPEAEAAALFRRWLLAACAVDLLIVLGLELLIGPALRLAFGPEFVQTTTCARLLIVAWGFLALRRVLTSAAQAQGEAGKASLAEGMCAVLLLLGVGLGSARYGIEGAAVAVIGAGLLCCCWLATLLTWRAREEPGVTT